MLAGLAATGARLTAIVNTGDDTVLHGLYVSPDLDTVTYTLAGLSNPATGWGLAGESWAVMAELARFEDVSPGGKGSLSWFNLGDRDLATHLYRTGRLAAGATLSSVTGEICEHFGLAHRLLPMSDDPVRTVVSLAEPVPTRFGGLQQRQWSRNDVAFQEYFVGLHHSVPVRELRFEGVAVSKPAPGVLEAIASAERLVICPSNPLVSVGPVLAVPGIAAGVARRRDDVIAVSPIVAGRALKGPADRMLAELGHEPSVAGVARLWAPYASTLVIDESDEGLRASVEQTGMRCIVAPTVMSGPEEAAALARVVLGA